MFKQNQLKQLNQPKLLKQTLKQLKLTSKQKLGKAGEEQAAEFLIRKGYKILTTNFQTKFGEIDIIARDGAEIVFVEVKTRTHSFGIHPSEAVDYKKLDRIFQTGQYFLRLNHINADFRCDIVTLLPYDIEHFENVSLD